MIVIVMGVAGAGKTTIGEALAHRLGWRFIDADDHHPPANVAKMAAGVPLDDEDRWPWLDVLNRRLSDLNDSGHSAIVACSALKESYRSRLLEGVGASTIVYLRGSFELIAARLAARRHRYMPASLLASQFDALEPPAQALEVDVAADPERCVERILERLQ